MHPILTAAERRALKARAHHLNPVVIIGDAGLTPAVLREIEVHLKSHELIKIRVGGDDRSARAAMMTTICTDLNASPVQEIGKMLVIFRPKPAEVAEPVEAEPRKTVRNARGRRQPRPAQYAKPARSAKVRRPAAGHKRQRDR